MHGPPGVALTSSTTVKLDEEESAWTARATETDNIVKGANPTTSFRRSRTSKAELLVKLATAIPQVK